MSGVPVTEEEVHTVLCKKSYTTADEILDAILVLQRYLVHLGLKLENARTEFHKADLDYKVLFGSVATDIDADTTYQKQAIVRHMYPNIALAQDKAIAADKEFLKIDGTYSRIVQLIKTLCLILECRYGVPARTS